MFDASLNSAMTAELRRKNLHVFRVEINSWPGTEEVTFSGLTRAEAKVLLDRWLASEPAVRVLECPKCGGSGGGIDPGLVCSLCDGVGQ